jgi:hypothetical protein
MSMFGRIGRYVMRRVVPPLDPAQFAAQSAVYRAAIRAAESPLGDEEAKVELRGAIGAHPAGVEPTVRHLRRDSYVNDRAFRLLSAAAEGAPVAPMPSESAELFERERELGQMPMRGAFALLKRLEPTLDELERDVEAGRLPVRESGFSTSGVPLGRTVAHEDPLLRSGLALNIAVCYLDVTAGSDRSTDLDTPYFSAPRKRGIMSGVLIGRPEPPPARPN